MGSSRCHEDRSDDPAVRGRSGEREGWQGNGEVVCSILVGILAVVGDQIADLLDGHLPQNLNRSALNLELVVDVR